MSAILANARLLKPEIRLAQAVSQFEADLSSEQKATFRTYKSQSRESPPSHSNVMQLTADIDRRASGKVGGRCFGPRLTSFLQAVQQFAALGDIVIGGSQNLIACGVWSVVRMSLLLIVNFSSYFEKLSYLLMQVGRSAPRHEKMALLYPRSKELQSYLSEYFIVVVGLCHRLLKITMKSTIGKLGSTLSDADLRTFQSRLGDWASYIEKEWSLQSAINIQEEARENSKFRALSGKYFQSASRQQNIQRNLQILNFCSSYDYETAWKQTRKVGNVNSFTQTAEYIDWKARADSCTLLYTGKLGSGKSVLLANIVDDLYLHVQNEDIPVAYFFCRHDIPESLKARTVIGSVARQLLRPIDLAKATGSVVDSNPAQDCEEIFQLLQRVFPPNFKAYFILDGLDEVDYTEREILIQQLRKLQEVFAVRLCVSLRIEPNNASKLSLAELTAASTISIPEDNPDIKAFIGAELVRCIESNKLVLGNPSIILEIQDALLKGSQGMFLWVALQIISLCSMKTDDDILQALEDLPRDLPELFSRILRRSEGLGKSYQKLILEIITTARRPLTTKELREALSVVPGDTVWNKQKLVNDIISTLSCCGSLLIVDEEETTVRLVHHSVKQFLFSGVEDSTKIGYTIESAEKKMAAIVVTYLSYGIFDTQLSSTVVPQITVGSTPSRIIHSTGSSGLVRNLALRLLSSRTTPNHDIGKTLAETSKLLSSHTIDEFHFYSYARSYLLQHILYVSELELAILKLACKLLKSGNVDIDSEDSKYGQTQLLWAAEKGHEAVVKLLLETGKVDVDSKDIYGRTPLSLAAESGHEAVVKLLLETGQVDVDSKNSYHGRTPLSWAAESGHEAVVKLLLETGKVDVDSKDGSGQTPLSWAAKQGHEAVVKLLLEMGQVDVNSRSSGRTPLSWAAKSGHEAVVKLLLETGKVDVDSKNSYGQTPLSLAAESGHEAVVKLLLETGKVDVDSKNSYDQTPLSWAAKSGHEAVVKLLLETGKVDVDSKDGSGQTPLSWAAKQGHEAVVKLLLEMGQVDVNSRSSGRTPLSWAAKSGHEAVVKLLLETGQVDVDSKNSYHGRTPLSWAAESGHEAVVKLLLETGQVDVDSKNSYDQTPLSWAAKSGHEAVVKLLLETGKVDVDSKNSYGQTPLSLAAESGHEAVVKLLLETGKVDVDSKDGYGRTPLSLAAESGHEAVVKLLLETGKVDVDSKNSYGQTPLSLAAESGHEAVVKLLLETGKVDVDSKDGYGRTPLSLAAESGHEAVVKLLLETGKVDVDSKDSYGWTPLSWAGKSGHEAVVQLLK